MTNLQNLQTEIWKDINGYEGHYQVSNLAKVKSLPRLRKTKPGQQAWYPEKILNIYSYNTGHQYVVLCKNAETKKFKIHRLVASAFIENPFKLPCINHINGIPSDNRIENLEWCTLSHNTKHAYKTGLAKGKSGSQNSASKLNEDAVRFIVETKGEYTSAELASKFGVLKWAITSVFRGDTWAHITGLKKRQRDDNRRIIRKAC